VAASAALARANVQLLWVESPSALGVVALSDEFPSRLSPALRLATAAPAVDETPVGKIPPGLDLAAARSRAIEMAIGPGGVRCFGCDEYVPEHAVGCMFADDGAFAPGRGPLGPWSDAPLQLIGPGGAANPTAVQLHEFRSFASAAGVSSQFEGEATTDA
jgi:hypothetical protein